jgi:hypothetical protein
VTIVDGEKIEIATPESGIALESGSKTFAAKTGAELLEGFTEWYFPHDRYITLVMTANAEENVAEFVYETTDSITYTVRHTFKDEKFKNYLSGDMTKSDGSITASFDGVDTFSFEKSYTITKGQNPFTASIIGRFSDIVTEGNVKTAASLL